MADKKPKIIYRPDERTLEIDGIQYRGKKIKYKKIGDIEHVDSVELKEVNTSVLQKKKDYIMKRLAKSVNPERIMEEVIKNMTWDEIDKAHAMLKKKGTRVKRHDGCLGLEIVPKDKKKGFYMQVFD